MNQVPNKRILICDDELHVVRAVEYKFRPAGYQVDNASNPDNAWEAIQSNTPDMLVTDVRAGGRDGLDLVRRLREDERFSDLPVILLTDKGFEVECEKICETLGVLTVVPKPFSPRELLLIVDGVLHDGEMPSPDALLRSTVQ